jgi:hypothetical protein
MGHLSSKRDLQNYNRKRAEVILVKLSSVRSILGLHSRIFNE